MATATASTTTKEATLAQSSSGLTLETEHGITTVADEVVAKLAGHACREVAGVASMGKGFRRLLGRVRPGEESLSQGVNVEVGKKEAAIDLVIDVRYGTSIPTLAVEVRHAVISAIESGTGLIVKEVNIEVDDMIFDEDKPAASRVE